MKECSKKPEFGFRKPYTDDNVKEQDKMKNTYVLTFETGCCTSEFDEIDGVVIKTEPFEMSDLNVSKFIGNHLNGYMNFYHSTIGPEFKFEVYCLETDEKVRCNFVDEVPPCGEDVVYHIERI